MFIDKSRVTTTLMIIMRFNQHENKIQTFVSLCNPFADSINRDLSMLVNRFLNFGYTGIHIYIFYDLSLMLHAS